MKPQKGLICSVFRDAEFGGDTTNNGISSKYNRFVLLGEGIEGVFTPDEDRPPLYHLAVNLRVLHGASFPDELVHYAFPIPIVGNLVRSIAGTGFQFGGNWLYTSDSRFPSMAPIRIMDRQEFK